MTTYKINIIATPPRGGLWGRAMRQAAFCVAVFVPGIVFDSAAMQWLGFLVVILTAFALVVDTLNKNHDLTIDEARKRLDEIEKERAMQTIRSAVRVEP